MKSLLSGMIGAMIVLGAFVLGTQCNKLTNKLDLEPMGSPMPTTANPKQTPPPKLDFVPEQSAARSHVGFDDLVPIKPPEQSAAGSLDVKEVIASPTPSRAHRSPPPLSSIEPSPQPTH